MPPTFTYSLLGVAPNQYLQLDSVGGTFESDYDLTLDTDIWPGDGLTYPVKAIDNSFVFSNNSSGKTNLRSIIMNNLTSITGGFTFDNYTRLESVTFSNLITMSGGFTFYNCRSLTDFTQVNLGTTITSYPDLTFYSCRFTNVTLPANITSLGNNVFTNNINLTSFLGPNLINIGTACFSGCTSLTDFTQVNLGTTITTYTNSLFSGCSFTNIILPSHITTLNDSVFSYNTKLQSFSGPNLIGIGRFTFQNCTSLTDFTQVNLGTTITAYPSYTFSGCRFVNITLPSHISILYDLVFQNNINLKSFSGPNLISIGSLTFSGCISLTDFTQVNLGTTITTYPDGTFNNCRFINVILPSHITMLGNSVFQSNINLKSFSGPNLTRILSGTFQNCISLTDFTQIDLGTNIISYPNDTFANCGFVNIILPSHILTLGQFVFQNNISLQSFTGLNITDIGNEVFSSCTSLQTCVLGPISSIPDFTFNNCSQLKNLYIQKLSPPTVTTYSFYNTSGLEYIFIPKGANWSGFTDKTPWNIQYPITSSPTYSLTPSSAALNTISTTPLMPMGYTVPYYSYKWYKNNVQLSNTTSLHALTSSIGDIYTVKAFDPFNQESNTEILTANILVGINYIKLL
jgi:hypothetical protein